MTEEPKLTCCPECDGELERGFITAQGAGVLWSKEDEPWWTTVFSRKIEKLQKDWWGFPKMSKEKLPALRCTRCHIVIARYTKED